VATTPVAPAAPDKDYYVFAASEGNDQIALIRFGPSGIHVRAHEHDGDHAVRHRRAARGGALADGKFYYVTTAHGTPFASSGSTPRRTTRSPAA